MMNKNHVIIIFLVSINFSFSQQIINNASTSENIPFVEIYSDKGDLIGLSDEKGIISPELNEKIYLSNTKTITLFHFNFEKKAVPLDVYKKLIYLTLSAKIIALEPVIISNNFKKKYLKSKGYFRSSQINEDKVQYFIDGIVEYYISTVSDKVKMKIIYHRTFENKDIKQLSKRFYFLLAGVPMFHDFFKFSSLSNEYNLDLTDNKLIKLTDKKELKNKGMISNLNNNTIYVYKIA